MKLNKLLERQIRKLLSPELASDPALRGFIEAVNQSYQAYERDIELSERAFRIAEEEYRQLNEQLLQEVKLKRLSIKRLREAVSAIGEAPLTDAGDEDLLHIATLLETQITKRRETEQRLNDQRAFYERILHQIPADIAIVDREHRYLYVNPSAVKDPAAREWIIGKTDEEYQAYRGRPLEKAAERRLHFDQVMAAGVRQEWEEKMITASGEAEYHLRILHPVLSEDGSFDLMIIYGFNITKRKKIEEQIKISEARYRSIFDNSLALICTHDLQGRILEINKAGLQTSGYSREELEGKNLSVLMPPENREAFEQEYLRNIQEYGKAEGIMRAASKEGRRVYLLYQNFLVTPEGEDPYVIGFSQDITPRIEAEKLLKKSEEKYRSIIANMNLGLVEVDEQEKILYVNNCFCEMCGYNADELIGQNAAAILLDGPPRTPFADIAEKRKRGVSDVYEVNVRNKNGELKWWLISGAPVLDHEGAFKGSIGIHLDITAHKQLEQELRKAKADAEHAAHAKEMFLANISHEIRTPMNGILGISNLLAKTPLDSQQHFYLDTIRNAGNNLLVIINDLLDFSKIESGKVNLEHIGFSMHSILSNAAHILKHKAEEKGLALSVSCAPDVAPVLLGDPYRINQVLINLLSNAVKFTEKGSVQAMCFVESDTEQEQRITLRVSDTGIGMSDAFMKQLFDKFTQEDESVTRKYGGTGLGMSISRQLVELMGGSIAVESRRNEGTVISFTLVLSKGTPQDLPEEQEQGGDVRLLDGKHILLAEDNEVNRFLVTTLLKQYGALVTEAVDGNAVLEKIQEDDFDMVLMDVQMPGKDGLEATRYIRAYIDNEIPIIALTANAYKQEQERCLQAGMNDFISKPFDEGRMIGLISRWLGRQPLSAQESPAAEIPLYNLDSLRALGEDDEEFIPAMMDLFSKTAPATLREMEEAFRRGDWKTLGELVHSIKPSFYHMGMASATAILEQLQHAKPAQEDGLGNEVEKLLGQLKEIVEKVVQQFRQELDSLGRSLP